MKIGVDLISGESPIEELIEGCVDALRVDQEIEIVVIGKGDVYRPLLQDKKYSHFQKEISRISILQASEVITMDDDPIAAIRQKKDFSMVKGLQAHKNGEIQAFFSPGNTGALVLASALQLGRVRGIKKPALVALLPKLDGGSNVFLDVGASAECEVGDLVKFAVMGETYAKCTFGINKPKIGLLNIGEEEHKGNELYKATYKRLSEMNINFVGNIEGKHLFSEKADVIVCDGNIGNICLKTIEGTASTINKILKQSIKSSLSAMLSLPLYKGALKGLKEALDPEKHGGVPLLGVNGNVFKGHGSSGREAIKVGILAAAKAVRTDILGKINREMQELHLV
jgi:phosphate acyltransferase